MKKTMCLLMMVALILVTSTTGLAQTDRSKVIRVGYVEGEPYAEFTAELAGMAKELMRLGVVNDSLELTGISDATEIWQELVKAQNGTAIFLADRCYTLSEMSEEQKSDLINSDSVDLYITMGTVAGRFMLDNNFDEDIMVLASADPVTAGLTKTAEERYRNNIFAHVDETRFVRQIQGAYNMLHFKKIGVVYEDSTSAYSYSGIEQLEQGAAKFGFEIVTRHVSEPRRQEDRERYYRELKSAYSDLSGEIDALYITTASIETARLPELLAEVHGKGIPTIAQSSEEQVKYGAFINVSISNGDEEGAFAANQFKRYIEGTPLKDLEQKFESTPKISINYATARTLGLKLPVKSLLVVDNIYGIRSDGQ